MWWSQILESSSCFPTVYDERVTWRPLVAIKKSLRADIFWNTNGRRQRGSKNMYCVGNQCKMLLPPCVPIRTKTVSIDSQSGPFTAVISQTNLIKPLLAYSSTVVGLKRVSLAKVKTSSWDVFLTKKMKLFLFIVFCFPLSEGVKRVLLAAELFLLPLQYPSSWEWVVGEGGIPGIPDLLVNFIAPLRWSTENMTPNAAHISCP